MTTAQYFCALYLLFFIVVWLSIPSSQSRETLDRTPISPWGNEDTQQLIDILGRYNIKATFFVVGEWVDKYPDSVKALAEAGHEIMNHSNDHAHFNSLSAEEIVANINACNDKIEAVTGVRPTLFRPPYGEYDDHVIIAVRGMGMEPIQWDVETNETTERLHRNGFRLSTFSNNAKILTYSKITVAVNKSILFL